MADVEDLLKGFALASGIAVLMDVYIDTRAWERFMAASVPEIALYSEQRQVWADALATVASCGSSDLSAFRRCPFYDSIFPGTARQNWVR